MNTKPFGSGMLLPYEEFAEFLIELGWKPSNDAQWHRLRDAMPAIAARIGESNKTGLLAACKAGMDQLMCMSNQRMSPQPYCDCCTCEAAKEMQAEIDKAEGKASQ